MAKKPSTSSPSISSNLSDLFKDLLKAVPKDELRRQLFNALSEDDKEANSKVTSSKEKDAAECSKSRQKDDSDSDTDMEGQYFEDSQDPYDL